MKGASAKVILPKDAIKTTITQAEIKLDQMRLKALISDISLTKSTKHIINFSESRQSSFITIQEDTKVKYYRLQTPKYLAIDDSTLRNLKVCSIKASAQVNVEGQLGKLVVMLTGAELNTLAPETRNIVKTASLVMTDDTFSLSDYVTKVAALIEESKDWVTLAKTGFIPVSPEGFRSLLASVTSQDSNMTEKTEEFAGLAHDEFCQALSKLSSSGIKLVNTHLKALIDLKREEGSDKAVFDVIEDKLVEILKDQYKDN